MAKAVKTIGVLTGDRDVPGMNATIHTVIRVAVDKGLKVKRIMHGYAGLLEEEIVDMESTSISDTINRGGTTLYTVRCREFATSEGQQKDAKICRKHKIDGMVAIGGDGSFRGAGKLSSLGIDTIGLPGTIDLGIAYTDYIIGFDMAVNTVMEAVSKVRDTSTPRKRYSIVEVMGRNAGYIALWCGTVNGAKGILLPKRHDEDEQALINGIVGNRRRDKEHNIIIDAEGIGHLGSVAKRIEAAAGIEIRTTILGYMQCGGTPTCKDRIYASVMGAKAAEFLTEGKSDRLMAYKHGKFVDCDIQKALSVSKDTPEEQYETTKVLVRQSV